MKHSPPMDLNPEIHDLLRQLNGSEDAAEADGSLDSGAADVYKSIEAPPVARLSESQPDELSPPLLECV